MFKTDCNCSFITVLNRICLCLGFSSGFSYFLSYMLISQSLLCSNFATVCCGFNFSYLVDSQQQMLVILLKTCKAESHLVGITLKSSAYIPILCSYL